MRNYVTYMIAPPYSNFFGDEAFFYGKGMLGRARRPGEGTVHCPKQRAGTGNRNARYARRFPRGPA